MSSYRNPLRFCIGLLISAVFLFLALRNVHWPEVWTAWQAARLELLLIGALILISGWGVAAIRWRILLAPAPGVRIRDTFAYITIGYLANTVLPLRLGDLARATLIGRKKNLGISRALGSIALERVMDLLALIGVTLVVALVIEIPPAIRGGITTLAAGGCGALIFMLFLALHQDRLHRLTDWLARFIPRRFAERIITLVTNFSAGAAVLRRPLRILAVFGLSACIWVMAGIATWLWIEAFQLSVPWYGAFFVLVVVNFGSAIPSSPGYIGVYHYLVVLALTLWVPDRGPALAYAIGSHALNMLANVSLGAYFLAREGVSLRGLRQMETESPAGGESS